MTESEIIKALIAAIPAGAVLVIVTWLIMSKAPAIIDKVIELQRTRNEGKKRDSEAQVIATEGVSKTVEIAISGMREVMIEQRKFNAERIDNMLSGMRLLEGRVSDQDKTIAELREELEDKNERILELERENERLHREVDTLRASFNKTQARKPAPKKVKAA